MIAKLLTTLDQAIADIEAKQRDHIYIKAKAKIDRLLDLEDERNLALRTSKKLGKLSEALTAQALLDKLQTQMNDIYEIIQGAGAKPICRSAR